MTTLEICLLVSLCLVIGVLIASFVNFHCLEKICKRLIKMNSDLFLEMLKLSEVEAHDQNPFEEFKGENH